MNRRTFLGAVSGTLSIAAGCAERKTPASPGSDSPNQSGKNVETTRPARKTATVTPSAPCRRDLDVITFEWTIASSPIGGYTLTVSPATVPLGGSLTARLKNVTESNQPTGIKAKYDIQYRQSDGWQSVFHYDGRGWEDLAVSHEPGEGFEWELTVSQKGLTADRTKELGPNYYVCDPLAPGTYRFIYFGIGTEASDALGAVFTVTET